MMKALIALLVICVSLVTGHAYATDPHGLRWAGGHATFHVSLDTGHARQAVDVAMREWQQPLGDHVQLTAVAGSETVLIGNAISEIAWESLPPEVESITRVVSRSGLIVEADIGVARQAGSANSWTLDALMTHELGHALGLEHADGEGITVSAAMAAHIQATATTLTRDDIAGIHEIYRRYEVLTRLPGSLTTLAVAFPPRNEPLAFRQQLETTYRDTLQRSSTATFVDIEGAIVWTQEYLRYRVNGCGHSDAVARVTTQILGGGVQPVCIDFTGATVNFPPRNEPLAFRQTLEGIYRDQLRRTTVPTSVDAEGDIVWTQEYFRYRVNSCTHQQATDRVIVQVLGGSVQPTCASQAAGFVTEVSAGNVAAQFVAGARPTAGNGPALNVVSTLSALNGGANQVALTSATPFDSIIVSVVADSYFLIRLPSPQTTVFLTIVIPAQVQSQQFFLDYSAALGSGPLGVYRRQTVQITTVGTGDVQINVSWNSGADVDLHVVEPNGNEIYYGSRRSSTGGELDLDSNAACGSDGPRAENIRWPSGRAPTGRYTVRVDHWSSCGASSTAYVVRVINGTSSSTFTGTFSGTGSRGGLGSGVTATSFTR